MEFAPPINLSGHHVSLVPLEASHHDDLADALRDGELWKLWYTAIPTPEGLRAEIERRLNLQGQGSMIPFAVIESASGRAVGMTTYMHIDAPNRRLEIGSTWYRRRVQRTPVNTECKLLLLTHAFERLQCIAVEFRTHFFNRQSRAAIERLGGKLDGILRQHQIARDGSLRDTCVYSVIAAEWPAVKANLTHRLGPRGAPLV
jgi:RimJ/RimL family protein N-acetyltransferase